MYYQKKEKNKYKNIKQDYGGRLYVSKLEARHAWELDMLKKAGEVKKWIPQYRVSLDIKRKGQKYHIANYYVDFLVILPGGSKELHECKGFSTEVWRLKWLLTEALYGDKYKMVLIK